MDSKALETLKILARNLEPYAAHCLRVADKRGQTVPFSFNAAQLALHERLERQKKETGRVRALVLKARQMGISTYTAARFYHRTTMNFGVKTLIVAHQQKSTNNLFDMVKRFHRYNPIKLSTAASNAIELVFDKLDSKYALATAGTEDVGRGMTAQLAHLSEYAFWNNAERHMAGLGNTVPDVDGSEIIIESTANGLGNAFHRMWQDAEAGQGEYIAVFLPWFLDEGYRAPLPAGFERNEKEAQLALAYGLDDDQLQWRRNKLATYGPGNEWLFSQEFPCCIGGDTRVGTHRGLIPMSELVPGDETTQGRVTAAWKTGEKDVIRLRTKLGYEVVCTPEHRIGLLGGEWLRADACIGQDIRLIAPATSSGRQTVTWPLLGSVSASVQIDERWGRLLGLIAGDGSLTGSSLSIACDSQDVDHVAAVASLVRELLGEPYVRHGMGSKGGGSEVRLTSNQLGSLWTAMGVMRPTTRIKNRRHVCVPECIWRSPKPVIREFLRGLFEADGFAGYGCPRVSLFSKYDAFLAEVQQLLLVFGITARRISRPAINGTGLKYSSNTLDLRTKESIEFASVIGFLSSRKQQRADSWIHRDGRGRVAFPLLLQDEVVSIETAGKAAVFDATVPGNSSFDAGGVLVHNCASEAFVSSTTNPLISPDLVLAAVNSDYRDTAAPLVIGCDPAGDGVADADRTAIVFRKGRMVSRVEYHSGLNTMQIAGRLAEYSNQHGPDAVFVDKGGLGAGVYDRLRELGVPVIGINSAERPTDQDRYENRRAEMWWTMAQWFADMPVRLPNDAALISDLTAPQPKLSSNGRRLVEKKDDMKKRGVRSPDGADALALTFAFPVAKRAEYVPRLWQSEQAPTTAGY